MVPGDECTCGGKLFGFLSFFLVALHRKEEKGFGFPPFTYEKQLQACVRGDVEKWFSDPIFPIPSSETIFGEEGERTHLQYFFFLVGEFGARPELGDEKSKFVSTNRTPIYEGMEREKSVSSDCSTTRSIWGKFAAILEAKNYFPFCLPSPQRRRAAFDLCGPETGIHSFE